MTELWKFCAFSFALVVYSLINGQPVWAHLSSVEETSNSACTNHDPMDLSVPLCPAKGRILDDTYPAKAIIIRSGVFVYGSMTEDRAEQNRKEKEFLSSLIQSILSVTYPKKPSLIVLQRKSSGSCIIVENLIDEYGKNQTESQEWKDGLVCVDHSGLEWAQDIIQPYFDSMSGHPYVRFNDHAIQKDSSTLLEKLSSCGIGVRDEKLNFLGSYSGTQGGNIESLPGGMCLVGSADIDDPDRHRKSFDKIAENLCGGESFLKVPTNFLKLGHVDEILKIVPSSGQDCHFKVLLADPGLGESVLAKNPSQLVFEGDVSDLEDLFMAPEQPLAMICNSWYEEKVLSGDFETLKNIGADDPSIEEKFDFKARKCDLMTDSDFLRNYRKLYGEYNEQIQRKLNELEANLRQYFEKQFENKNICQKNIIVRVPMIFGELRFKKSRFNGAMSIFPNVVNGFSLEKKNFLPTQYSGSLEKSLNEILADEGVQYSSLRTSRFHPGNGNLHCKTNIIRYCRPNKPE